MSPDLNPIEHLWGDLETAVGRRHPSNLGELEQFAQEEWDKLPVERCNASARGVLVCKKCTLSYSLEFWSWPLPLTEKLGYHFHNPAISAKIVPLFGVPMEIVGPIIWGSGNENDCYFAVLHPRKTNYTSQCRSWDPLSYDMQIRFIGSRIRSLGQKVTKIWVNWKSDLSLKHAPQNMPHPYFYPLWGSIPSP